MTLFDGMNISPVLGTNQADNMRGTGRSEVLSGAGGDDTIQALSGHDEVFGGTGNDTLYGQGGNDTMYGNGKPKYIDMSQFQVTQSTQATVTFLDEGAGFRNALGVYEINADGSFSNVQILFPNASKVGSGGDLIPGQSNAQFDVTQGAQLGFFVVSNGYGKGYLNREALSAETGHFELRNSDGAIGSTSDRSVELYHVDDDGSETAVRSQYGYSLFHSIGTSANDYKPNPDEFGHVVGRANTVSGEVLIGFEDLYGGGDKDFDDTVISVHIGQQNVVGMLPQSNGNGGVLPDDDMIYGGDGNDTLYGISGDDMLSGGNGDDNLNGNSGEDMLYGNDGNDVLNGNSGNDYLSGGNGNDELSGNSGNDELHGNDGNDELSGNSGNDTLNGGNGSDRLEGGSGDDVLNGGNDSDILIGGSGTDTLDGGSGNDTLSAGSGDDILEGGSGSDTLNGNSGNDQISGGSGSDTLNGHSGDDVLSGGSGQDRLVGGGGADTLDGGEHNDRLYGGSGNDTVNGGTGNDYINAGSGDDQIDGGSGNDKMIGGSGSDNFIFTSSDDGIGTDWILDLSLDDTMTFAGFDFASFNDLMDLASQNGNNVSIDLSDDECINIRDCQLDSLQSDMMFFI